MKKMLQTKKIAIQTGIIAPNGHEIYISFSKNPFSSQEIAFNKWMWIKDY